MAKSAYDGLSNFANGYRMYAPMIGEEMVKDHKLLQEYVTLIICQMIKAMAEQDEGRVTIQNQDAVKLCRKLLKCISDTNPRYL